MSVTVGVDVSTDGRATWTSLGTTTSVGVVAFDVGNTSLVVSPTFWVRISWNGSAYLYLAGEDFGDACVNHRLRKAELGLRASGSNTLLDSVCLWVEPIVERQQYFTVNLLLVRDAGDQGGRPARRSVYKQYEELSALLDLGSGLEPPNVVVTLEDPLGRKWDAMITNIKEQGMLEPAEGPSGLVVSVEFLLLRQRL